jgi:predicted RNase H-like HicB family nuclease
MKQAPKPRYHYEIEKTGTGYSAYAPDVPGCIAAAKTREETIALLTEAIEFHEEMIGEEKNRTLTQP